MRFILTLLTFKTLMTFGQVKRDADCPSRRDSLTMQKVYTVVSKMPEAQGGPAALLKEISGKLKYPRSMQSVDETKVVVAFVIDEKGRFTGKRIIKGISGTGIASQLLDILKNVKWNPGLCEGKAVPVIMVFPMNIEIGE